MTLSFDEIARQIQEMNMIIAGEKCIQTQQTRPGRKNGKKKQTKNGRVNKSTISQKKNIEKKKSTAGTPEKNKRLCPWIEIDEKVLEMQKKPLKKKKKNTKKAIPKKKRQQKQKEPVAKESYSEDPISSYNDTDDFFNKSSTISYNSEEDVETAEMILNSDKKKSYFRKWHNRFMIKICCMMRESREEEYSTDIYEEEEEEEEEEEKEESQGHPIGELDSEEKEKIADFIIQSYN